MRPWNTVQGHTLLTDPRIKDVYAMTLIDIRTGTSFKQRVEAFLFEEGNWPNHPEGVQLLFLPQDRRTETYCHCYYYVEGGTCGVIEFDQRGDTLHWRITSESEYPPLHAQLDPDTIALLGPPPNRTAESWRYSCLRAQKRPIIPVVGMGVTNVVGSDRSPFVVTEVVRGRLTIGIQRVHAKMVAGSGQSEHQVYEYGEPYGETIMIHPSRKQCDKNKNRWYRAGSHGDVFVVGYMDKYRDPSF